MSTIISLAISELIKAGITIWAHHAGKPAGWKPTAQDLQDFLTQIDADSPEAMKSAAAARLGIQWPPSDVTAGDPP